MPVFDNSKDLWAFITEDWDKPANIKSIYSARSFFKDLKRSKEELYINGILMDPILDHARNQIDVAYLAVKTIGKVIRMLKQQPNTIEDAYNVIASIPKLTTDSFETALLNAAELIEPPFGPFETAFRSFSLIRSLILSLERRVHSKEEREEKLSQIKKELDIPLKLKIRLPQIETKFLDKAANKIFEQLFENNGKTNLKRDIDTQRIEEENNRKECLKKFLKLSLHQNFIFSNVNLLNKLGAGEYVFSSPSKRTVKLNYTDDGLVLKVSFFIQKAFDYHSNETLETTHEDFFVKGVANYKINIQSYSKTGWVAKFDLIDSSVECTERFKAVLDKRNILEKFQEFLTACLEKIMAYMSSSQPVNRHKFKCKPIFFISNTGSSFSKVIKDPSKSHGNILNIIINNML